MCKQWFIFLSFAFVVALLSVRLSAQQDSTASALRHIQRAGSRETAAVVVTGKSLLHTTQLFPLDDSGNLVGAQHAADQIERLFSNLAAVLTAANIAPDQVVKLNFYVHTAAVRDAVWEKLADWVGDHPQPAVSFVATDLPHGALVALDAIAASEQTASQVVRSRIIAGSAGESLAGTALLPRGDVVYVAGQAERAEALVEATRGTLAGLGRTLEHLGLKRHDVVQVKCFMQPMAEAAVVEQEIVNFFADALAPPVAYVEWVSSLPIEIELVAHAPAMAAAETVSYSTPPWMTSSAVYSRVARIHGDRRIYIADVVADEPGDGAAQVRSIFRSLRGTLPRAGSSLQHLAKATYYVSRDDSSRALNDLRPNYYHPQRPPAASKAQVRSVGVRDRSIVVDMIAAPATR